MGTRYNYWTHDAGPVITPVRSTDGADGATARKAPGDSGPRYVVELTDEYAITSPADGSSHRIAMSPETFKSMIEASLNVLRRDPDAQESETLKMSLQAMAVYGHLVSTGCGPQALRALVELLPPDEDDYSLTDFLLNTTKPDSKECTCPEIYGRFPMDPPHRKGCPSTLPQNP